MNTRPKKFLALGAFAPAMAAFVLAAIPAAPASAQEFDVNAVFWCDAGKKTGEQTEDQCKAARDAILGNCTSCHAITPIVKAQKPKAGWVAFMGNHRQRVPDIAEDVYGEMTKFLQAHYNPQNKPPKLPPELDALGVPPA
jgi:uncharacterized membrane protein